MEREITMQDKKKSFVGRVGGVFLSAVFGLMSFGGLAVQAKGVQDSQITSSVSEIENEKKSEQYYKTKTGKCYHKGSCSCLKKSKIEVSKEEIEKADLKPCSKCCK